MRAVIFFFFFLPNSTMKFESISGYHSSSEWFSSVSPSATPFHSLHWKLLWPMKEEIWSEHSFLFAAWGTTTGREYVINGTNPFASQLPAHLLSLCLSTHFQLIYFQICPHLLSFLYSCSAFFFITISYSVTPVTFTLSIFISNVNPMTDSKLQIHKRSPILEQERNHLYTHLHFQP